MEGKVSRSNAVAASTQILPSYLRQPNREPAGLRRETALSFAALKRGERCSPREPCISFQSHIFKGNNKAEVRRALL